MVAEKQIDQLCIDTIRTLSMDAVQAANSGHPGTPMAMALVVYCLWQRFLRFDPNDPIWPNRDRFVLSMGKAGTPCIPNYAAGSEGPGAADELLARNGHKWRAIRDTFTGCDAAPKGKHIWEETSLPPPA